MIPKNLYCANCPIKSSKLSLVQSTPLSKLYKCNKCSFLHSIDNSPPTPSSCPLCSRITQPSNLLRYRVENHSYSLRLLACESNSCVTRICKFENKLFLASRVIRINNQPISICSHYMKNNFTIWINSNNIIEIPNITLNVFAPNIINKVKTYITFS
jgi:hypothetical protein